MLLQLHLGHQLVLACPVVYKAFAWLLLVVSVLVGGQFLVVVHVDLVGLDGELQAFVSFAIGAHLAWVLGVVIDGVVNPDIHARAVHTAATSLLGQLLVAHDQELVLHLVLFLIPQGHWGVHGAVLRIYVVHAMVVRVG